MEVKFHNLLTAANTFPAVEVAHHRAEVVLGVVDPTVTTAARASVDMSVGSSRQLLAEAESLAVGVQLYYSGSSSLNPPAEGVDFLGTTMMKLDKLPLRLFHLHYQYRKYISIHTNRRRGELNNDGITCCWRHHWGWCRACCRRSRGSACWLWRHYCLRS